MRRSASASTCGRAPRRGLAAGAVVVVSGGLSVPAGLQLSDEDGKTRITLDVSGVDPMARFLTDQGDERLSVGMSNGFGWVHGVDGAGQGGMREVGVIGH